MNVSVYKYHQTDGVIPVRISETNYPKDVTLLLLRDGSNYAAVVNKSGFFSSLDKKGESETKDITVVVVSNHIGLKLNYKNMKSSAEISMRKRSRCHGLYPDILNQKT